VFFLKKRIKILYQFFILFYFESNLAIENTKGQKKKCTSLYIFGSLLGPCMGIWSPKFLFFLEFLQLFQQIIENSHPQKEEG